MDEPSVDPEEVEPRLFLIGPACSDVGEKLSAVLDAVDPVAFLLASGGDDLDKAAELRRLCGEHSIAFFVQDDAKTLQSLSPDGLHRRDPKLIKQDRKRLGDMQILGAEAGRSRHAAMVAGEHGADYVAFGRPGDQIDQDIIDLVSWWREMTVLPCLTFAETPDDAAKVAEAGADFIGVSAAIWDDPDGPDVGALRMQAAILKN